MPDAPSPTEEQQVATVKPRWRRVLGRASGALLRPTVVHWLWPVLLSLISFSSGVWVTVSYTHRKVGELEKEVADMHYVTEDQRFLTARFLTTKWLTLSDASNKPSSELMPDGFVWRAAKGNAAVTLEFDASGNPSLAFNDRDGKQRLVFGSAQTVIAKTGEERTAPVASITLFDREGKVTRTIQ